MLMVMFLISKTRRQAILELLSMQGIVIPDDCTVLINLPLSVL
jgi:hypothetical protein